MIAQCCVCGRGITVDERYRLVPVDAGLFQVSCLTHTARSATHTNSQAGELHLGNGCLRPADKEQENG
jgi:hypothetical protein